MDIRLIFEGKATIEDLVELHEKKGVDIVLGNGTVSDVIFNGNGKESYGANRC